MANGSMRSRSRSPVDEKLGNSPQHLEHQTPSEVEDGNGAARHAHASSSKNVIDGDEALRVLGHDSNKPVDVSPEKDARVLRKIDIWLMPVILMVYFLQQLDKSSLSYTSVFGIVEDTNLVGRQYSWLSSIVYLAQMVWQPASSYMLVRLPVAKYLSVHVFMWGVVVASTSAAKDFRGLMAARFFLGIFEATVAPCFILVTQMWWRRREQTMRLSMWMAMNGGTGMIGSLLSWGLGHIGGSLRPWQTIFLFIGLLTLVLSPIVFFVLPDSPTTAKFLTRDEKIIAIERLRANNQGTETKIWKWDQVTDALVDPKTYLWFLLLFACAVPSGGIGAFGPLIIQGFGFNQFHTILFNIPFSFLQVILTLTSAYISQRTKLKWPVILFLSFPPIAGASALFVLGRGEELRGQLLACYYVLSFFTAIQPMLYTWSSQNTAGHTKKQVTTAIVFVAQCAGNVVGPLMYRTEDRPYYTNGLLSSIVCWVAIFVLTLITAAYLKYMNSRHAATRQRLGKAAVVIDTSLDARLSGDADGVGEKAANENAFRDLTDVENEDFIYVL